MLELANVRPDNKGRVLINRFIKKGVSSYDIEAKEDGSLLFIPQVEVSFREMNLIRDKKFHAELKENLKKAIKEEKEGKLISLGSFQKHLEG
ncbi:MAG: hypothetical protein ACTSXL_04775 [Alphaproteobacteria bacterium]|nr:MAG: hypothetical protein B6I23_00410 [Rickettsiaceae bacterium 4572_127]